MMESARKNLRIFGGGSAPGGVYEAVTIAGSGDVNGDVEAEKVSILGSGKIHGNVKAETVSINGSGTIQGQLDVQKVTIAGSGTLDGRVVAETMSVKGSARVQGNINARAFSGAGSFQVNGDVETEGFRASGSFRIEGLLSGDSVSVTLAGRCRAREVGGGHIDVTYAHRRVHMGLLEAESIEGDDVLLEGTTARVVRGRRVRIGSGCQIGTVEYSESLRVDPSADVGEHIYTGTAPSPPPVDVRPLGPTPRRWAPVFAATRVRSKPMRILLGLAAAVGIVVIVSFVVFTILPAIGVVLVIVLSALILLPLLLGLTLPFLAIGAVVGYLLLLPWRIVWRLCRGRRVRYHA
jgi:cytoskeletal protein CcmA (bactofilin family)